MISTRTQIQDIRKRIQDLKESRRMVSSTNKRLQTQIDENRKKRASQSEEIKNLFIQIREIRKTVKVNTSSIKKIKKTIPVKKEPIAA